MYTHFKVLHRWYNTFSQLSECTFKVIKNVIGVQQINNNNGYIGLWWTSFLTLFYLYFSCIVLFIFDGKICVIAENAESYRTAVSQGIKLALDLIPVSLWRSQRRRSMSATVHTAKHLSMSCHNTTHPLPCHSYAVSIHYLYWIVCCLASFKCPICIY